MTFDDFNINLVDAKNYRGRLNMEFEGSLFKLFTMENVMIKYEENNGGVNAGESFPEYVYRIFRCEYRTKSDIIVAKIFIFLMYACFFSLSLLPSIKMSGNHSLEYHLMVRYSILLIFSYYIIKGNWKVGMGFVSLIVFTAFECDNQLNWMQPQTTGWDLRGIICHAAMHGDWGHATANLGEFIFPLILLTFTIKLKSRYIFTIILTSWVMETLAVALFGDATKNYRGSSGILFGVLFGTWWLIFMKFNRNVNIVWVYTAMIILSLREIFPWFVDGSVGWLSHLGGVIGGVISAILIFHFAKFSACHK